MIEYVEGNIKKKEQNEECCRCLAYSYFNLAKMFFDESYARISIDSYKNGLHYSEKHENDSVVAYFLKKLGLSYLAFDTDSAMYYFNKSVETDPSNHLNKIDIDKALAMILFFDEGFKDSAYSIIKNNLDIIEHDNVRDSYYILLGEMLYEDKRYDSALYYLERCVESTEYFIRLSSAYYLSALYDSINDMNKKAYYDGLLSKISFDRVGDEFSRAEIVDLYNEHRLNMHEIRKNNTRKRVLPIIMMSMFVIMALILLWNYRNKRKSINLLNVIDDKESVICVMEEHLVEKDSVINDVKFRNSIVEGKIKKLNAELRQQSCYVKKLEKQLTDMSQHSEESASYGLKTYCESEICAKIMELENNSLTQENFALLLDTANLHLDNIFVGLSEQYPRLKKEDLYYLCLVLIDLGDKQIASLFGVAYNTIRVRRNKICEIFDVNDKKLNFFYRQKLTNLRIIKILLYLYYFPNN